MKPTHATNYLITIALVFSCLANGMGSDVEPTLHRLQSPNASVRVEALRELQTSLDPRIPEAMLPLLGDEGDSIRRLAARAIGSRWWQIPKEQVPHYLKALQASRRSEYEDERNMAARAVGLLKRDYKGPMFARSRNGRWVLYERRQLPCLIDTHNESEELLGWFLDSGDFAWLASATANLPLSGNVLWHPKKEMVAMEMIPSRYIITIWVWRHTAGVLRLDIEKIAKELGNSMEGVGFYAQIYKWDGDELLIEVSSEKTDFIAWDVVKNTMRSVSSKK